MVSIFTIDTLSNLICSVVCEYVCSNNNPIPSIVIIRRSNRDTLVTGSELEGHIRYFRSRNFSGEAESELRYIVAVLSEEGTGNNNGAICLIVSNIQVCAYERKFISALQIAFGIKGQARIDITIISCQFCFRIVSGYLIGVSCERDVLGFVCIETGDLPCSVIQIQLQVSKGQRLLTGLNRFRILVADIPCIAKGIHERSGDRVITISLNCLSQRSRSIWNLST